MTLPDLLDPWIDASFKGFPHDSPALRRSQIGAQGWNVLAGDLPLPLAVIRREVLRHNLHWMQDFARSRGLELAPHGKTSMSPQLFRQQLDAGAWGMTFATVTQLGVGIAAGSKRCLIANQVFADIDLQRIDQLQREQPALRIIFLVDSVDQLELIEAWQRNSPRAGSFEVLLEIGVPGGRTGCRDFASALTLAARLHASAAVRLVGVECYEGLAATGDAAQDEPYVEHLMDRVHAVLEACVEQDLMQGDEILLSAGGSAVFDLVARRMTPRLGRAAIRGLLRSGCYVTHDQGSYKRMMSAVASRTGCGTGLQAAMEVWARVQSCPEPGLAILAVGKRDLSHDWEMPIPLLFRSRGSDDMCAAPADWKISGLNDQHAHLRASGAEHATLRVGDLICLGISHPCTTFDKWRWMPLVDEAYNVRDAIVTCF